MCKKVFVENNDPLRKRTKFRKPKICEVAGACPKASSKSSNSNPNHVTVRKSTNKVVCVSKDNEDAGGPKKCQVMELNDAVREA